MACLVANLRTQSWQRYTAPLLLQSSSDCGERKDSSGTSFSVRVWESLAVCFGDSLARSLILNPRWDSRWHTYAAGVRICEAQSLQKKIGWPESRFLRNFVLPVLLS